MVARQPWIVADEDAVGAERPECGGERRRIRAEHQGRHASVEELGETPRLREELTGDLVDLAAVVVHPDPDVARGGRFTVRTVLGCLGAVHGPVRKL
jgi:hypothetical protein